MFWRTNYRWLLGNARKCWRKTRENSEIEGLYRFVNQYLSCTCHTTVLKAKKCHALFHYSKYHFPSWSVVFGFRRGMVVLWTFPIKFSVSFKFARVVAEIIFCAPNAVCKCSQCRYWRNFSFSILSVKVVIANTGSLIDLNKQQRSKRLILCIFLCASLSNRGGRMMMGTWTLTVVATPFKRECKSSLPSFLPLGNFVFASFHGSYKCFVKALTCKFLHSI